MESTINHNRGGEPAKDLRESFNQLLIDKFGIDTVTGLPMWRISWAPDQFEKQFGTFNDFTPNGIFIRTVTEVREVPKYPHLQGLYILEHLMGIPAPNRGDLPTATLTYECMHPYMHAIHETYLPPQWEFTEWVIDCYYSARRQTTLKKYFDPDADGNNGLTAAAYRYNKIAQYLYGNETAVGDALSDGTGVFMDSTRVKKPN